MKFNVPGKALYKQLTAVSKVLNAKNALSILDNFLLDVNGDRLTITGSDSENVMSVSLEVMDSDSDGRIAIPAKRLLEVIKEISNQPLTFIVNDDTKEVVVNYLSGEFTFMGVDAAEFPVSGEQAADVTLEVPATVIVAGLENTLFAVSTEQIRPIMTGICWDVHKDDITFVSSDTHKLVRYINSTYKPGAECCFILPAKPASILKSMLEKEEGLVRVDMDSKSACFTFGDFTLSCRFIKGNYPNYNRVIPQDNPFTVKVDRTALLTAVRRVALFASKASSLVRFSIGSYTGIDLASQDLDYATQAKENVKCDYEGNDMTIGFNAQYMQEVLGNLYGDNVIIKLSDPARPGLFMPEEQNAGEDVVMLQMPMQVLE